MGCDISTRGKNITPIYLMKNSCLYFHNLKRLDHGCPALEISEELCKYSQSWANNLANKDDFIHSDCLWNEKRIGENLANYKKDKLNGEIVVNGFYEEIKNYNFDNPSYSESTANFSQLIWKETKLLGVGVATAKDGSFIVVLNYYPPGNIINKFETEVPRKLN